MSIKTDYSLEGINIPNAIIRIERLWGSSKEGWSALVTVSVNKVIPAVASVGIEGDMDYVPAQPETTELVQIKEFNHQAPYAADERGYVSMYNTLMAEFGGVMV